MDKSVFVIITMIFLVSYGNYAFAQSEDKLVVLETNLGKLVIEMFPEDAPNHVSNFIVLAESGFYDGTIFHRIIPGFMIQGGDPNTIDGDPSTWGIGGPTERVDAEFNTIKHNRGIVSMARSTDPDSGGSQFFIVHKDSNSLDGKYSVFGRIVTNESFETLDKIASVETTGTQPVDIEQVKLVKAMVVNRSDITNLLELKEPERTRPEVTQSTGNQNFESAKHEIALSVPEGWLLQQYDETEEDYPDVVAVGPKIGVMNPVISLTIGQTNEQTLDDLISQKMESIKQKLDTGELEIISQEKIIVDGNEAHVINARGVFSSNDEKFDVKFRELLIYDNEKHYTLAYSNGVDDFDLQLPRFEETIDSFEILSKENELTNDSDEGGGCLIATATFDSELAPQVQQLRELRDNTILSTESGTAFMTGFNQFYYLFSPTIADLERENPIFKEIVKISITPMLSTLSLLNYADIDSEEKMLSFGIAIVLMNVGMYLGIPAVIIYKIRK